MNAHFEPLSGIVRVFRDGNTYGDSYEWCATCRFLDQKRVEILGVTKPMTPSIWRAVWGDGCQDDCVYSEAGRKRQGA